MFMFAFTMIVFINAVIIITLLLDLNPFQLPHHKKAIYFLGIFLIILMSFIILLTFGPYVYAKYYTIFVQLPALICFTLVSRHTFIKVVFVTLTAIFLTFPCTSAGFISSEFLHLPSVYKLLVMIMISMLLNLFINKYVRTKFIYILETFQTKEIIKFCFIPLFYTYISYRLDHFILNKETFQLQIFLFISTSYTYIILMDVFRKATEVQQLTNDKRLLNVQKKSSLRYLSELRKKEELSRIYRHDMRHHFIYLQGLANHHDDEAINHYLSQALSDLDEITPVFYCNNDAINLILSAYMGKAKEQHVNIKLDVKLPEKISILETELCSLFSNSIENAIKASALIEDQSKRIIQLNCYLKNKKFILEIKNNTKDQVTLDNHMPYTNQEGHGYGTKSMVHIAKKYHGSCDFIVLDHTFTVQIVIPLRDEL